MSGSEQDRSAAGDVGPPWAHSLRDAVVHGGSYLAQLTLRAACMTILVVAVDAHRPSRPAGAQSGPVQGPSKLMAAQSGPVTVALAPQVEEARALEAAVARVTARFQAEVQRLARAALRDAQLRLRAAITGTRSPVARSERHRPQPSRQRSR